ncbi:class F sortase [Frigoribacterium sp. PhB24]|uniref:class F sortase n=1 Tax=Frigoribacterium sp. PhB24 TaxID=2485204 RepID=UPI000F4842B5|nr:class F sortase [Frigoribacterium sp. PhB24]ROS48416.1 hypothetical protein EDF50_2913 [Frigoribacterium sp. PhB24]
MTETAHRRGRRRWELLTAAAGVSATFAFVIAGITHPGLGADQPGRAHDLAGNIVVPEATGFSDVVPVPAGAGELVIPKTGLRVEIAALRETDRVINPPGFDKAYWVQNRGVGLAQASAGTVFIAMHSLRGGGVGPGNYLIDVEHRRSKLQVGDDVFVGSAKYRVKATDAIEKTRLGQAESVWDETPGKLVLITCLQRPEGGESLQNIVIEAQLQP